MIYGGLLDQHLYKIKNTDSILVTNVAFQNVGT